MLAKVLESKHFKDSKLNHEANQISADMLKMFAILHCQGASMDKAKCFYNILQDGTFDKPSQ